MNDLDIIDVFDGVDHKSHFKQAILDVKKEFFISSYGISPYGFTENIYNTIFEKIQIGVNFYFIIGLRKDINQDKTLGQILYLDLLSKTLNLPGKVYFSVGKTKHGKILIKDNDLAIVSSYNWLTAANSEWENYSIITTQ